MSRIVISLLMIGAVLGAARLTAGPCASAGGDPPLLAPRPPRDFKGGWYLGTLLRADADGIEIDGSGGVPHNRRLKHTGRRSFALSAPLRAGDYDRKSFRHAPFSYRVQDLQLGDQVEVYYNRVGGEGLCTEICIIKRPGGRVPPAPGQKPDDVYKWHEIQNAWADWMDYGIPLPDKYHPGGHQAGIAPMPRVVGDKFIPADPHIPPAKP